MISGPTLKTIKNILNPCYTSTFKRSILNIWLQDLRQQCWFHFLRIYYNQHLAARPAVLPTMLLPSRISTQILSCKPSLPMIRSQLLKNYTQHLVAKPALPLMLPYFEDLYSTFNYYESSFKKFFSLNNLQINFNPGFGRCSVIGLPFNLNLF